MMSLIQILNYSQKKEFEIPPVLDDATRNEVFALPVPLQQELENLESDANRALFIAMYGFFKLKRFFYPIKAYHLDDITYIQKQYSYDNHAFNIPSRPSVNRYKQLVRDHFGYQAPDDILRQILRNTAGKLITQLPTSKALFYALVEISIECRYEVPSYTFLSKIITDAMN